MNSFVSRRIVLQGIAVAVVYGATVSPQWAFGAVSPPGGTVTVPTAATTPTMRMGEAAVASSFDAEWTVARTIRFPRIVDVDGVSDSFDCVVRWDERLFSVADLVLAETDQVVEVSTEKLAPGQLRLSIPAATKRLYFDATPQPLYPNDNIDQVVSTSIELANNGSGSQISLLSAEADALPASPWGIELAGEWTTTEGLITPASLMVLSVGPNPTPAGLRLEISCPRGFDTANFAAPEGAYWTFDHQDEQMVIHVQLTTSLLSGMSIMLGFDQHPATTEPRKNLPFVSRALAVVPETEVLSVRNTGKMTAFPLTGSGIPVSTFKQKIDPA